MGIRRKRGSTEATGEPIGHSWTLSAHSGAQHRTARGGVCVWSPVALSTCSGWSLAPPQAPRMWPGIPEQG